MSHTTQWAVQNFLQTHEDCQLYLQAAFDEAGDDAALSPKRWVMLLVHVI